MLGGFAAGKFLSNTASEIRGYSTAVIDSGLKSTDKL